jgi:hypothetical protein
MKNEVEFQPLKYHPRYTELSAARAFQRNIVKAIIELVKNSVDSYERLYNGKDFKNAKIIISYGKAPHSKKILVKVEDFATGVNYSPIDGSKSFPEIMEMGAPTSGYMPSQSSNLESIDLIVRHGVGLKDVLVAWVKEEPQVISIKDNKLTHLKFIKKGLEFGCKYLKKDEYVKNGKNGFIIASTVPKDWFTPKIDKLWALCHHRELRKVLELKQCSIILKGHIGDYEKELSFDFPKGEVIKTGSFVITHKLNEKDKNFVINYSIKLSDNELRQKVQTSTDRVGGLLIYYGKYSVLDLTLFDFENTSYAKRIFGEVKIIGEKEDLKMLLEEGIIDEKRMGLIKYNEFNIKLAQRLNEILGEIVDKIKEGCVEERISFSELTDVEDYIAEINALINSELEIDEIHAKVKQWIPPKGLGFFPSNIDLEIKECESKKMYLKAIKSRLPENVDTIKISSNNLNIRPSPEIVKINKDIILEKIDIFSEKAGEKGKISANCGDISDEINVIVSSNERIHPNNGFAFIPNEQDIVNNKEKVVPLIFDKNKINLRNRIYITSDNKYIKPIKKQIPIKGNFTKIYKNICEIKVPLKGKSVGNKGTIIATCSKKNDKLFVKVIEGRERKPHGLLEDIDFDPEERGKDISRYEDGIIHIHTKHPVIRTYLITDEIKEQLKKKEKHFLVLLAKIIALQLCEITAIKKLIKTGTLAEDLTYDEYKGEFDDLYHKLGANFHNISLKMLAKMSEIS